MTKSKLLHFALPIFDEADSDRFEPTSSRMGSRPGEASVATHAAALL